MHRETYYFSQESRFIILFLTVCTVCVCCCALIHKHVSVCVWVSMYVCLCSFQHHLHLSHLSAADFPLNMIEMPLAMNNTFTLYCTSGEVLHDRFPLLEYVKYGKSQRCFRKQKLGKQHDFKDWEKNAGRHRKTGKINNKKGKKQPQQSVMICVPSRTAFAGRGEESVRLCVQVSACPCVCLWVSVHVCVWGLSVEGLMECWLPGGKQASVGNCSSTV